MTDRRLILSAAILGFLGVALGAFGAHALHLEGRSLEWWHTASQYHLMHVLAALLAASLRAPRAGWLFLTGTLVFSGSLYAMALTKATVLGAITPLGGLAYLAGWATLAISASRESRAA